MELSVLVVLILMTIAAFCLLCSGGLIEGMTGYGTMSGLAYNSKGLYCFKNIYDPPTNPDGSPFDGYCSIIGKVVV